MDRETRNQIQHATQDARVLLEEEYAEQLQGIFDIRLDGTIADTAGPHLDLRQRLVRSKLVAAITHLSSANRSPEEAVASYLREAAFTTLNRFVALKMLEARGLVQECLSRGQESSGFREFAGLAPGLVQLSDSGYRLYLESLFDEIARDVRVLFDRRDPASLLWPRWQVLLDLQRILNGPELETVWDQDETIGWVYQYFNSRDDRQRARYAEKGQPKAPQNSYELAVRNQFFTPRYVVRFLTDNTLRRVWYEMRRGDTSLRDLEYLVRRPNEVFLDEAQEPPASVDPGEGQRPLHVPFRPRKDPRDIRVLDPACGSGHFLLYAFDLLVTIYDEAWEDTTSPPSASTGRALRDDHPQREAFRAAVPGLILRHNLHGIDIDNRCVQIAALTLWMRSQRVYSALGIPDERRPAIQKTNIVTAEPMSGEPELAKHFIGTLSTDVAQLVKHVFDQMELAGEVGSLLRIEDEIRDAVRRVSGRIGGLFRKSDQSRWKLVEAQLRLALNDYSTRTITDRPFARRLFSHDTAQGLSLIDLCQQKYDAIVLNPPYGTLTPRAAHYASPRYPDSRLDCAMAFAQRSLQLAQRNGLVGALLTRTVLLQPRASAWRQSCLQKGSRLIAVADLGYGVLDATVETAALCYQSGQRRDSVWIRLVNLNNKNAELRRAIGELSRGKSPTIAYLISNADLSRFPKYPFSYWAPPRVAQLFETTPCFETKRRRIRCGMGTLDDYRFVRAWWEVKPTSLARRQKDTHSTARWVAFAKAGETAPFLSDTPLVVNYSENGKEVKALVEQKVGTASRKVQAERYYFCSGLQFGRRVRHLSPALLPAGQIFSDSTNAIFIEGANPSELLAYLGLLSGQPVRLLLSLFAPVRKMEVGYLKRLPVPHPGGHEEELAAVARAGVWRAHERLRRKETSRYFEAPHAILGSGNGATDVELEATRLATEAFGIRNEDLATIAAAAELEGDREPVEADRDAADCSVDLLSWTFGIAFRRFCPYRPEPNAASARDPLSLLEPMPVPPPALDHESPPIGADWILVDDQGHQRDVLRASQRAFDEATSRFPEITWDVAWEAVIGKRGSARAWMAKRGFAHHLRRYSSGNRKAPVYWQLATPTASYSVWLYYHRFTRDTLYRVLSEYVVPKLNYEERKLAGMTRDASPSSPPSERKRIDGQEQFVAELRTFRDEIARVAPLWNPDPDDGVIINFSLLWRLVPHHRSWQKECRRVWYELVDGEYDWAHLAMRFWPERVVPRCADDRSFAIAHGLERVFWEERGGKWTSRRVSGDVMDRLIEERTSTAVKFAIDDLLGTPASVGFSRGHRGWRRRRSASNGGIRDAVREVISASRDGASKSDIIKATGISDPDWHAAIGALLARGIVTKTGTVGGTRYCLSEKGGSA